jgi:hypothetical protein
MLLLKLPYLLILGGGDPEVFPGTFQDTSKKNIVIGKT